MLVGRYFELEDPATVRPIGLELKLSAQFGEVTLRGIIDRLEIDADGELVVTDYKTGSVPGEYHENARLAGVRIYAALCERMLGRRPARVQLYYLSRPEAIIATPTEQMVAGRRSARPAPSGRRSPGRASARTSAPTPGRCATTARSSPTAPRSAATPKAASSAAPARSSSPACRSARPRRSPSQAPAPATTVGKAAVVAS